MYFIVTTLSCVGLGDLVPKSDIERLFGSFLILTGVIVFNLFINEISSMVIVFRAFMDNLDCLEKLPKFYGILFEFNGRNDIDINLQKSIDEFFMYSGSHDRTLAINDDDEK